ncbi:unnamed protein product [Orchesella dallaii]|uniref:O-acyltransferase WSD1 C-terminal domain-containing protein n=1 Tax=Orchesella dallaii TaxID=48710 RepID=A0ABP1REV5_9HEXA
MWLLYKIVFVIFNILTFPLHLILFLSLIFLKIIVKLLARQCQDFVGPIPGSSCVFLADNIWDNPHSSIVSALELDGNVTKKCITDTLQNIYDVKNDIGERSYRELGYYPVRYFGYGFWKQCENFNLADCVHELYEDQDPKVNEEPLPSIAERMLRQSYLPESPIWDIHLYHNFNGKPNRTLIFIRFHHLLADGLSIVKLLHVGFGHTTFSTPVKPSTSMTQWDNLERSFLSKVKTILSVSTVGVVDYFDQILLSHDKNGINYDSDGKLKITGKWICSFGKRFDINDLTKAGRGYKCSVSHIFLAAMSTAMKNYFLKYHETDQVPDSFHIIFPVPIPNHPDWRLVNHWTLARIKTRLDIQELQEQMEYLKEEAVRAANSPLPLITAFMFQRVCGILPTRLVNELSRAKASSTIVFSNLAGPQVPEKFGGAAVVDMFFWMPIVQQSIAVSAGLVSCNGGAHICLTADLGCIPDRSRLDDLGMMIYDELQEICKVARTDLTETLY